MAAEMIPARQQQQFVNCAEWDVYQALERQLPDGSTVVYDLDYVAIQDGRFYDGQVDFIAMVPRVGVCFIEVKGSKLLQYRGTRLYAKQQRNGREEWVEEGGFDQACRNKHRIVRLLRERCGWQVFPARYGHLLVYPRGELQGGMPVTQPRELLVTRQELEQLGQRVLETLPRWGRREVGLQEDDVERIVQALLSSGELVPVVAAEVDADRSAIEALTRDQFAAWQALLAHRRVVVIGPAGSGKTILARAKAHQLLESGCRRVLLTCFNRNLASYLRREEDLQGELRYELGRGLQDGLHVCHFHQLASEYVNRITGLQAQWNALNAENNFWPDVVPTLFDQATLSLGEEWKFDGIIIDEGQDFGTRWITTLELLLREPGRGPMMLCLGDGQRIYHVNDAVLPGADAVHRLRHNCRNTRKIATYAAKAGNVPAECLPGAVDGEPPLVLPSMLFADRAASAARIVRDWLDEGIAPSRIAVLSPWGNNNPRCSLDAVATQLANRCTSDVNAWKNEQAPAVWRSTVKAFKGLEADCVVLTDVGDICPPWFTSDDLYVAVSRARTRLVILPMHPNAHEWLSRYLAGL